MDNVNCQSNAAMKSAQKYYNEKGEWKGKYTMTPLKSLNRDSKTCDIRYKHVPVSGHNGYTGTDFRTFEYNNKGDVVKMGGYKSGTLVDRGHSEGLDGLCKYNINHVLHENAIKKMESAQKSERNDVIKLINEMAYIIDSIERDTTYYNIHGGRGKKKLTKGVFKRCKTPEGISHEQILKKKNELNRLVERLNRKWKTKYGIPFPEIKLKSSLNFYKRIYASRSSQYRKCNKTVTELRKEINSKKIEITDITNKLKEAVKKRDEIETKYSNLKKSKTKCDSSISTLESDKKKLNSELELVKSELDKKISDLKSAKDKCESDLDEKIRLYDEMVASDKTNYLLILLVILFVVILAMYFQIPNKNGQPDIPSEINK